MARWFFLAAAAVALAVGVYFFAAGESREVGGGMVSLSLLLLATGMFFGRIRGGEK